MRGLICYFSFFLFLVSTSNAQEIEVREGDFLYGIAGGANFGKVNVNDADLIKSGAGAFVGISGSYALTYRWRANFSGYFSMRTSILDDYYQIRQTGVDLQAFGQFKIDDLYLNFGIQSQTVASQRNDYQGNSNFRLDDEIPDYTVPTQQFNPLVGIELKLMDNWRLFANYTFSPGESYSSTQVGLAYRINKRSPPPETQRSIKRRLANKQIRQLRNGALLIRLKTAEPTILAMRRRGFDELADQTEREQREENLSLIRAFRAAYNFSEIKFFYSSDSRSILEGNYEGVFLNDSLERDSSIVLHNPENVFTCELAKIEQDTAQFFSHYEFVQTGNFAMKQVPRFYGPGGNTFFALVVKDHEFNQLSRPFPYYSRALFKSLSEHPGHGIFYFPLKLLFSQTPLGSVENLNDKLHKYWKKVND